MSKKNLTGIDHAAGADSTVVATVEGGEVIAVRQHLAEPEGGWPADEFTGEPGQFVRDPYTGVRSRAPAEPEATAADE